MQPHSIGASGGRGGYDLNHTTTTTTTTSSSTGLTRFRSAPPASSWLDALLSDTEDHDSSSSSSLKPSSSLSSSHIGGGGLTQLLTTPTTPKTHIGISTSYPDQSFLDHLSGSGGFGNSGNLSFHRQNSSPADFFGNHVDGFFSSGFGVPTAGNYDYSSLDASGSGMKRAREAELGHGSSKFIDLLKKEQQHGRMQAGGNGFMDLEMERMMEDSVPWRTRAKRGCATHPRSIAERVRRTRISDRIRKLQELVPNMDKQTNTADMLDEAVEYVKRLQEQIHELTESQKKCRCIARS